MNIKKIIQEEVEKQLGLVEESSWVDAYKYDFSEYISTYPLFVSKCRELGIKQLEFNERKLIFNVGFGSTEVALGSENIYVTKSSKLNELNLRELSKFLGI